MVTKKGADDGALFILKCGTRGRSRTCDFFLRREALYPLSYASLNLILFILLPRFNADRLYPNGFNGAFTDFFLYA